MAALRKKEYLAGLLGYSGLLGVNYVFRQRSESLKILAYHRIMDIVPDRYPFDEDIVSASCEVFDRQLNYLSKNFDVITFMDLADCHLNQHPFPKRPLIITFDDGYSDNYKVAFPLLKKYRLPATIFLSTGYIDTNRIFWFESLIYILKHTPKKSISLPLFEIKNLSLATEKDKRNAYNLIQKKIDHLTNRMEEVMGYLEKMFEVPSPDEASLEYVKPLSWDQIIEMGYNGIEFGSHTVSHPVLSNLEPEQLEFELSESKKEIEKRTGKPVIAISYPSGKFQTYNKLTFKYLRKTGYLFGISYLPGTNPINNLDCFDLKRIPVEFECSFNWFKSGLAFPNFFLDSA